MKSDRSHIWVTACVAAWFLIPPPAAEAATCAEHSNQASAQRAKDTRDGDGDGVYCETLPCPCSRPGPEGSGSLPSTEGRRGSTQRRVTRRLKGRVTSITDGDTMKVYISGRVETVRLVGIDTPESRRPGTPVERGSKKAARHLHGLAFTRAGTPRRVTVVTDASQSARDRYGRLLGYVIRAGGRDFNREQVRAGWAKSYVYGGKPYRKLKSCRRAQSQAKRARRGVWRACGGNFHRAAS